MDRAMPNVIRLLLLILIVPVTGCTPATLEYFERLEDQPQPTYGRIESVSAALDSQRIYIIVEHCHGLRECDRETKKQSVVDIPRDGRPGQTLTAKRYETDAKNINSGLGKKFAINWHREEELFDKDGSIRIAALDRNFAKSKVADVSLHGVYEYRWDNTPLYLYLAHHDPSTGAVQDVETLVVQEETERKPWHPLRYVVVPVAGVLDLAGGTVLAAAVAPIVLLPVVAPILTPVGGVASIMVPR